MNGPIIVENFEETGHSGPNLNYTKGYLCKGNASKTEYKGENFPVDM